MCELCRRALLPVERTERVLAPAEQPLGHYKVVSDAAFDPSQEEKQSLEQKLAEVSVWETRLAELLSEAEAREARKVPSL
jgi:hypothetical protein